MWSHWKYFTYLLLGIIIAKTKEYLFPGWWLSEHRVGWPSCKWKNILKGGLLFLIRYINA